MVRVREDGTFSVCAVGYSVKLDEFIKKNECPCVAQWPSGGYLCAAWGSATPTIIDGEVIKWAKPCTFEEAQTCPFFKDEARADSEDWIYWVRRRNVRLKGKPESTLLATCPKCHQAIELDVSSLLKSITDVFKFNEAERRKVIEKVLKEMKDAHGIVSFWLKGSPIEQTLAEWIKALEGSLK